MKSKWLSVSAALCLSMMITSAQPGNAQLQPLEQAEPQWMTEMLEQGWQKAAEGVLQRKEGEASPVETFIYNGEGLLWRVEWLQGRVRFFEGLYNSSPSEELAGVIADLEEQIGQTQDRLRSGQAEEFTGEEMANCTINYGASAVATHLTVSQAPGVTGTASAYFNSNCGHTAYVYASVHVNALDGTVQTTKTQTDDKPASTASSAYAQFSAKGSSQCFSSATARVYSPALNLLYDVYQDNYLCPTPPPKPVVSISGQTDYYTYYYGPQCATVTWYASGSSGTAPYSIDWYIGSYYQSSGSSYSLTYCNQDAAVTVTAKLTDSAGEKAEASSTSWVYHEEDPYYCGGYNCNCGGGGYQYPRLYDQPYDQICPAY